MVIYTSPIAETSENYEGRIIVDESDYRLIDEKLPFETKDVVRIRAKEKFSKLYECFDVIGEGKFGKVYRCREKESGLELAAKRIKIKRDADREKVEKEVAIMTQMRHPRIAQIYDAFSTPDNDIVLVMEVVPGGELFDRVVEENYILTELAVVMIICQLCEAVDYIHNKHIVHLDIKPENIMCVSKTSNRIKLIDFGLAQYYDGTSNLLFMAGTPEFVAPEVIKYEPIDFHTDMWSIGVITYILLSGISPFLGETLGETYCAVEKGEWEFDEECFEGISEAAKDFISNLLVYDQKQRMLPAECLQHTWIVQARARTACRSPVCEIHEGKPISKEFLRFYIKNQRFRKATWAVLFLMRFRKFGHINWQLMSKLVDKDNKNSAKLPAICSEVNETTCSTIQRNITIKRIPDLENIKGEMKMEVPRAKKTIKAPMRLTEKYVQPQENIGKSEAKSKQFSFKNTLKKKRKTLSDHSQLDTQLTLPLREYREVFFIYFGRKVKIQMTNKPRNSSIRKRIILTAKEKTEKTIKLKKMPKEFNFRSSAKNEMVSAILKLPIKESVYSCLKMSEKVTKRNLKTPSRTLQPIFSKNIREPDPNISSIRSQNDEEKDCKKSTLPKINCSKKMMGVYDEKEKKKRVSKCKLEEVVVNKELDAISRNNEGFKLCTAVKTLTATNTAKCSEEIKIKFNAKKSSKSNKFIPKKSNEFLLGIKGNIPIEGKTGKSGKIEPKSAVLCTGLKCNSSNNSKLSTAAAIPGCVVSKKVDLKIFKFEKNLTNAIPRKLIAEAKSRNTPTESKNAEGSSLMKTEYKHLVENNTLRSSTAEKRMKKEESGSLKNERDKCMSNRKSLEPLNLMRKKTLGKNIFPHGMESGAVISRTKTNQQQTATPEIETESKNNNNKSLEKIFNIETCQETFKIISNKKQSCSCYFNYKSDRYFANIVEYDVLKVREPSKKKFLRRKSHEDNRNNKTFEVNLVKSEAAEKARTKTLKTEKQENKGVIRQMNSVRGTCAVNENSKNGTANFRLISGKFYKGGIKNGETKTSQRVTEVDGEESELKSKSTTTEKSRSGIKWLKNKLELNLNKNYKDEFSSRELIYQKI